MAPGLKWWVFGPLIACAAIAVAIVGRGSQLIPLSAASGPSEHTSMRDRAIALATQWRNAELTLRLYRYRRSLESELASLHESDQPSVASLLVGPDAEMGPLPAERRMALDSAWQRLGLGVTKVSVGVIVTIAGAGAAEADDPGPTPRPSRSSLLYLLPDSTDRATCLAVVLVPNNWLSNPPEFGRLVEMFRTNLGPCAFYARFGVPSVRVRNWLDRREYDLAGSPVWLESDTRNGAFDFAGMDPVARLWWRSSLYSLPPAAVRCLGGRAEDCRAVLREGDDNQGEETSRIIKEINSWRLEKLRLLGSNGFLGAVARSAGPTKFLEFWNTTLPVDSALTLALGRPVGEWTAEWQTTVGPRLSLGPAPSAATVAWGLILGCASIGIMGLAVSRRQVQ